MSHVKLRLRITCNSLVLGENSYNSSLGQDRCCSFLFFIALMDLIINNFNVFINIRIYS